MGHHCECACAGVSYNAIRVHSMRILVSIWLYFRTHDRNSVGVQTKPLLSPSSTCIFEAKENLLDQGTLLRAG